jgi:hypothetical protein
MWNRTHCWDGTRRGQGNGPRTFIGLDNEITERFTGNSKFSGHLLILAAILSGGF